MDESIANKDSDLPKRRQPSFGEAASYWVKLGFTSFGGPAGQIAMMQSECVDKRGWIGQGEFLRGLNSDTSLSNLAPCLRCGKHRVVNAMDSVVVV